MIIIYTDGSSRGNPGPGGWGAVIAFPKSENNELGIKNIEWVSEIGGREDHTTNNRMELTAAIKALEFISNLGDKNLETEVIIYTDSEYVMKGITEWIHGWQKKGWRTASKKPVLNQDLWQELLSVTENINVTWKYVAGHTGVSLNERADEIATTFADGFDPKLYNGPSGQYR
ncbi:MAG: ribonuclease HI [Candidatus Zambryskibacteria bacterium CG_4_9_14_3_um_filter_42_9]|uniref:Ribonuclease H n=1 Tax=Candidatus Zambryskibacteria bacterium CG22_combo_CG10-13_8_21_14_all_42_17 TaxID=1975118 RepID=A0A2H0BDF9_9BACT|nr:MAG: ribonuclease HI [Candidatus Zambryskibacteria bacterium CG22_combo_CG10-13_8_21_14_all_42_17]PJA36604.1 MAG: ribonuclease HI [Candidatus Zambryskibacteria bacterium CG_4_9_14_3_um_filter_42_9]